MQNGSKQVRRGFSETIGNTPLVRIRSLSELTGCDILGKAEFLNPGGSVKDRPAWTIIRQAEKTGALKPGGTVVEGTAGNTGIGIAHICNARGYKCVIYMPDNQAPQKADILSTLGAEVRLVPPVPYKDENNYQRQAGRYAASLDGAIWANQFDNTDNLLAHYESTGPEIWEQTDGNVDAFVCSVGTGGTIAGVSQFLKERNESVQVVLSDCMGSALHNYVTTGETVMWPGPSITEGIGNSRVTDNFAQARVDWSSQVTDQEMVDMVFMLLRKEGWFLGSSSGINLCGAVAVAGKMGRGKTIVTILADSGTKYQERLFNSEWLAQKNLRAPVQ